MCEVWALSWLKEGCLDSLGPALSLLPSLPTLKGHRKRTVPTGMPKNWSLVSLSPVPRFAISPWGSYLFLALAWPQEKVSWPFPASLTAGPTFAEFQCAWPPRARDSYK